MIRRTGSGRSVLRADARVFGAGYPGRTPAVVVTYDVSRLDTATMR